MIDPNHEREDAERWRKLLTHGFIAKNGNFLIGLYNQPRTGSVDNHQKLITEFVDSLPPANTGYQVFYSDGQKLSRTYTTRDEAQKTLDFFKTRWLEDTLEIKESFLDV